MKTFDQSKMNRSDYMQKLAQESLNKTLQTRNARVNNDEQRGYYSHGNNEPYVNAVLKENGDNKNPRQESRDQTYKKRLDMYLDLAQKKKLMNDAHYQDMQNELYLNALKTTQGNNLDNIILKIAEATPMREVEMKQKLVEKFKSISLSATQSQDICDIMNNVEIYILHTFWVDFLRDVVAKLQGTSPSINILIGMIKKFVEDKFSDLDDDTKTSLLNSNNSKGGISNVSSISFPSDKSISSISNSSNDSRFDLFSSSESENETLFSPDFKGMPNGSLIINNPEYYRSFYGTSSDESKKLPKDIKQLKKGYENLDGKLNDALNAMQNETSGGEEQQQKVYPLNSSRDELIDSMLLRIVTMRDMFYKPIFSEVYAKYNEKSSFPVADLKRIIDDYNFADEDYDMLRKIDKGFNRTTYSHLKLQRKALCQLIAYGEAKKAFNKQYSDVIVEDYNSSGSETETKNSQSSGKIAPEQYLLMPPSTAKKPQGEPLPKSNDDPFSTPTPKYVSEQVKLQRSETTPIYTTPSPSKYKTPTSFPTRGKLVGVGLIKKPKYIIGKGLSQVSLKHDVELKKLNDNILAVRYKNNSHGYKVKPIKISQECKKLILSIASNEYFDEEIFETLSGKEKCIVEHYIAQCKIPIKMNKENLNNLTERFEVLKGQIQSGNNNPQLRQMLLDITELIYYFGYIKRPLYEQILEIYG
jgi:hypothetical protein